MADKTIDIDKLPRQEPVLFSMPNKDPDLAKQRKHEWYVKNKEEILKRKRERRAAKKKQQPPQPKPPPSPEQIARTKELNRQACHRYRTIHLAQVRLINRVYYHKNRDRRAAKKRPFRKLRTLADVCSERLRWLDHEPANEEKEKCGTSTPI